MSKVKEKQRLPRNRTFFQRQWYGARVYQKALYTYPSTTLLLILFQISEFSSLKLSNCTFSDNYGSGGVLSNMVGNIAILTTDAFRNGGDGILAQRILGAKGDEQGKIKREDQQSFQQIPWVFVEVFQDL